MPLSLTDTIAAIASPGGPALRGILRVSGQSVTDVIERVYVADQSTSSWREAGHSTRFTGRLQIPSLQVPVPTALMFWPDHRSYTGQPMAEFHLTGCEPVLDAALEHVLASGARAANRGEFTLRAFLTGRMDLVQAEAVLGVIDASDHEELSTALSQLGGGITAVLRELRGEILSLLGDLEAGLDFVDEDIEFISNEQIVARLQDAQSTLAKLLTDSQQRLKSGIRHRVVLAGLPNAGKSSLFNCLLERDQAIVSPVAGTTRDYVSGMLNLDSCEVELIDTAGMEIASDLMMQQAQDSQHNQMQSSDLVVWCKSATLNEHQQREDETAKQRLATVSDRLLSIATRSDEVPTGWKPDGIAVSSVTSAGIDPLRLRIEELLTETQHSKSELVGATAARCRDSLRRTQQALRSASDAAQTGLGDEIVAMELRDALQQIATMLGEVYTDDILDHIFSNFCIGK
ncbi:MAG: tRNA uridine-5-carboxymethylaminomethyl(34) synthesis GTPase MnmE [Fuerstiella sp.]